MMKVIIIKFISGYWTPTRKINQKIDNNLKVIKFISFHLFK